MHLFALLSVLLNHVYAHPPPISITCHGSPNGGLAAERPFAVFFGRARPRPLRHPIGRKGCAPPVCSRVRHSAAAQKESDGSAVSGGEASDLSRLRLALGLLPSHAKERFTLGLLRRRESSRTNVGCDGGIGVSYYDRIFDVGCNCDHFDAQDNLAVYDTTSGTSFILFSQPNE